MKYIHQKIGWPHFTWDAKKLVTPLAKVRHHQGLLIGRMRELGFQFQAEASLLNLTQDVIKSSAIEGEILNQEEVRSSIAQRLGIKIGGIVPVSRHVDGVVEMMLDATQAYNTPLSMRRLFSWHAALFPTGYSGMHKISVGAWRTERVGDMSVVSGPVGRERIHFVAPDASRVNNEIKAFIQWFNAPKEIDPVLRAALSHLWFVTIHPFEDGNGRIARAIADMSLARSDGLRERFYSMSSQIAFERKLYYSILEATQKSSLDVTNWLLWFVECLNRAIASAEETLKDVFYKEKIWRLLKKFAANERQKKVVDRLLGDFRGYLTSSKYAKLAKCSQDTALRDISELRAHGILIQNPGSGRSTSYQLCKEENLFSTGNE